MLNEIIPKKLTNGILLFENVISMEEHQYIIPFIESLKQKDIIVAGGQEQWKSRVFRIGHMVLYTDAELQRLNHSMLEILEYIS